MFTKGNFQPKNLYPSILINTKFYLTFILLAILASCKSPYHINESGVSIKVNDIIYNIEPVSANCIHFYCSNNKIAVNKKSIIVREQIRPVKWTVKTLNDSIYIETDSLQITLPVGESTIRIRNRKSKKLYITALPILKIGLESEKEDAKMKISQSFQITKNEGLYGLGQFQEGIVNWRNQQTLIAQSNTYAVVPYLVSSHGYGLLWDNYSMSLFSEKNNLLEFSSAEGNQIEYYFVGGNSIDDAIAGYRQITGEASLLPAWAYGYWQSKERYKTGDELIQVATEYRKRKIPLDVIVQDWSYWGNEHQFSGMVWDSLSYPDPKKTIEHLHHNLNTHILISVWPAFGDSSAIYRDMDSKKFLFNSSHWSPSKVYDAYNSDARNLYWKYMKNAFFDKGIDGWWLDASEPEFRHTGDRYITSYSTANNGNCALGPLSEYLNTYSLFTTKGVYENQRKADSSKRVCILTRSAFAGQQANGSITWSGDIFSNWTVMNNQIAAGINISMAGIPYWTSDIGGFLSYYWFPEGVKDAAYRELYVRWFQFGAFCPIFRSHGTNTPREIWQFGNIESPEYKALKTAIELRYRLIPYIYSEAGKVTQNGSTLMRGLAMDFPNDKNCLSINDQFMFGPSILVCPMTKAVDHLPSKISEFIPANLMFSTDSVSPGWQMYFYEGNQTVNPVFTIPTDNPNITWEGAVPEVLANKSYSVKISGVLLAPESGIYHFSVTTNGSASFIFDGQKMFDNSIYSTLNSFTTDVVLEKDHRYSVSFSHFQPLPNNGNLIIEWTPPTLKDRIFSANGNQKVYLPKGREWFNFWTGEKFVGGTSLILQSTMAHIPLFVPAGSIIPMGPIQQFVGEKLMDTLELRIYPGKNAQYNLYEDSGEGYGYENGEFSVIPILWNDETRTLTLGNQLGKYSGITTKKLFRVVLVDNLNGNDISPTNNTFIEVNYQGILTSKKF